MKILIIGDIFGRIGRDMVFESLERLRADYDLIIANAENAMHGRGLSKSVYDELVSAGIDGFTMGNHTWDCRDIENILKYNDNIIRPANFEGSTPGRGSMLLSAKNGKKVGVINLIGRTYMSPAASPFEYADREVKSLGQHTNIIFVDFHAEATSEKMALGYYLDGRVSAVFGTHTHVQTADNKILPNGTGFITDIGMTGPSVSILGADKNTIINRFLDGMPQKFVVASGKGQFCGAGFEIDDLTGKTTAIERFYIEN